MRQSLNRLILILFPATLLLGGCDIGGGNGNDSPSPPMQPPPANTVDVTASLDGMQVVTGSTSGATVDTVLTLDEDSGALSGDVPLDEVNATTVQIRQGFAGDTGPVLINLEEMAAGEWSVPADTELTEEERGALEDGRLYLLVTTDENPDGALRGQLLLEDVEVSIFPVRGEQEVPAVDTNAMGWAAITLYDDDLLAIHVNTMDLQDETASHIHRGLAGTNGPIVVELSQDVENAAHWFVEDVELTTEDLDDLNQGRFYVNVHTMENPGGELRGQLPGDAVEIEFTALVGEDVVPPVDTDADGMLATTIRPDTMSVTFHLNTRGADDATAAAIHQAPLAQNGPVAIPLEQDVENFSHWSAVDVILSSSQYNALRNQGLYALVSTPAFPEGAIRGQLQPENSQMGSEGQFIVSRIQPANGATVETFPVTISLRFNAPPLDPVPAHFEVRGSGGDGSFGDGNETAITVVGLMQNGQNLELDFTGVEAGDDTYQVRIVGTGPDPLTDEEGKILDGDRDGTAGGDAIRTFTVSEPPEPEPEPEPDPDPEPEPEPEPDPEPNAFNRIQTEIFNPTCAVSGCHAGGSPAAGMNLSQGQAYDNLVDVQSSQNPELTRVIPGNADDSLLVQKVEGTAPVGARMPLGGAPLSNSEIQLIRDWIDAGAPAPVEGAY